MKTSAPQAFLEKIRAPALAIEAETGIPWVFAATQAAHESRYGNSKLTVDANNLFGITGDTWYTQGKPVYWIETTEYNKDKIAFKIRRPFRKYADWTESLRDWASLIQRRYPAALAAAKLGNFKGFAEGLVLGGYATDPSYSTKLVSLHRSIALTAQDTPIDGPDKGLPGDSRVV
jgi:flagellum-specific peptidoglycan hydrolase FlgJ